MMQFEEFWNLPLYRDPREQEIEAAAAEIAELLEQEQNDSENSKPN